MKRNLFKINWLILAIGLLLFSRCKTNTHRNMIYKFHFDTSHNQFYLLDKNPEGDTDAETFWTNDAFNDRLAIEKGILGIATESYGNIKGELVILNKANDNVDYGLYDHIVEGSINIQSGEIQILNCPDNHLEFKTKLNPGYYRARIYSSNLNSVKEPDLTNDSDNDFYKIELWPEENMERKVLKKYTRK